MPQPKLHANHAARTAAYRARKRASLAAKPHGSAPVVTQTPEPTAASEVHTSQDSATLEALMAVEREIRLLRRTVDGTQP